MVDLVHFLSPVHEHAVTFSSRAVGLIPLVESAISADVLDRVVFDVVRIVVNVELAVEVTWFMTLEKTLVSRNTRHTVINVGAVLMLYCVDILALACSLIRTVCDVSIPSLVFLNAYII